MANIKVSELNEASTLNGTDYFMIIQNNENKKALLDKIQTVDEIITSISLGSGYSITVIKRGNLVLLNGILNSNVDSGSITLPYSAKYTCGCGLTGYYPETGNIQGYGYITISGNTLSYKASSAFSIAPISIIYYTED